jgi:hypothetical protein
MTAAQATAKQVLFQLDSPAYVDDCLPLVEKLGDALNPLYQFIHGAAPASLPPGPRYAATAHLTSRGLSERPPREPWLPSAGIQRSAPRARRR